MLALCQRQRAGTQCHAAPRSAAYALAAVATKAAIKIAKWG
jgi:hypothetical protein